MVKRLEANPVGFCAFRVFRAFQKHGFQSERNPVDSPNRKLIRPSFNEMKEKMEQPRKATQQKRPTPPDQTNAENFYYVKQMQAKTPMVITLKDGEVLKGSIEWYDRSCLKVSRDGEPNVLVYKSNIKYMHKDE